NQDVTVYFCNHVVQQNLWCMKGPATEWRVVHFQGGFTSCVPGLRISRTRVKSASQEPCLIVFLAADDRLSC
ncbi:hypothetical protein Bpfe_001885, partial [Biomphalaria pfeifferi]